MTWVVIDRADGRRRRGRRLRRRLVVPGTKDPVTPSGHGSRLAVLVLRRA